jgi:hypothetical protein
MSGSAIASRLFLFNFDHEQTFLLAFPSAYAIIIYILVGPLCKCAGFVINAARRHQLPLILG